MSCRSYGSLVPFPTAATTTTATTTPSGHRSVWAANASAKGDARYKHNLSQSAVVQPGMRRFGTFCMFACQGQQNRQKQQQWCLLKGKSLQCCCLFLFQCANAAQLRKRRALKLPRAVLCLLQWYFGTSRSSCLVAVRIRHFRTWKLSKTDDVLKHPVLKWHKILLGLFMRMFFFYLFCESKNTISMKCTWPKPTPETKPTDSPKAALSQKSSLAVVFASPRAFLQCSHSACGQVQIVTFYNATLRSRDSEKLKGRFSGRRKFLCSKAITQPGDGEDYRRQRSNKAYGRSEYTMPLCASCILFIDRATNYCIVSPMTHFSASQWSLGDAEDLNVQPSHWQ